MVKPNISRRAILGLAAVGVPFGAISEYSRELELLESSPMSRYYMPHELGLSGPPDRAALANAARAMRPNSQFVNFSEIDFRRMRHIYSTRVLHRSESWERGIAEKPDKPGYPALAKDNGCDGLFHLFYAIHNPYSGIACATSQTPSGPYIKIADQYRFRQDSRILSPPRRNNSHFSSPVVVWNDDTAQWHLYFHYYHNEFTDGRGHQKTIVAYAANLTSDIWEILRDENGRPIATMPVMPPWMNSQSSYHVISKAGPNLWLACLRGTSVKISRAGAFQNTSTSIALAYSPDGLRWCLMEPHPNRSMNIRQGALRPNLIGAEETGELRVMWTEGNKKSFVGGIYDGKLEPIYEVPRYGLVPFDGAATFWRENDRLYLFTGQFAEVYAI